jgi:uncharacterized protein (DUF2237 family)
MRTQAVEIAKNVYGQPLVPCSFDPLTGFFRDGCCKTDDEDRGLHVVCAVMTEEFLRYSLAHGNDLITPRPEWSFPGLQTGDQWCLCATRWRDALLANVAPPVVLESTHIKVLTLIDLDVLERHAHRHPEEL